MSHFLHERDSGPSDVSELVPEYLEQPGYERPRDDRRVLRILLLLGVFTDHSVALFDLVKSRWCRR